jgi:hypothetical protein
MSDFVEERIVKVVFDTEASDSAGVSNKTATAHPSGVFIPKNAIITNAFYEVNTQFTTAGADAGTLAIMVHDAGDLLGTIAVSAAGNVLDTGTIRGTLIGSPAMADGNHEAAVDWAATKVATYKKVHLADEEVTFTIATQAFTAGKLTLYIEYIVGE